MMRPHPDSIRSMLQLARDASLGSVVGFQLQLTLLDCVGVGRGELETTPEFMNCRTDDVSQEHCESRRYPLGM